MMKIRVVDFSGLVKWLFTDYIVFVDPKYLDEFLAKFQGAQVLA